MQVFPHCGLEAWGARSQLVISYLDGREGEHTAFIRCAVKGEVGVGGGEGNLCARDDRALFILDEAGDGALVSLRPCRRRGEHQGAEDNTEPQAANNGYFGFLDEIFQHMWPSFGSKPERNIFDRVRWWK